MPSDNTTTLNACTLSVSQSAKTRYYANAVSSWYCSTLDPYTPHASNVASRLRHPVRVITRRILYGDVDKVLVGAEDGEDNLEAEFTNDDADIKEGPEHLTRRTQARMEAFISSCSVALRAEDEDGVDIDDTTTTERANRAVASGGKGNLLVRNVSTSSKVYRQIDHGDLMLRLDLYCRSLRRIRVLMDANPNKPMEEAVIQYEPKKTIRSRVRLIVQTYLRNVDCVRDVHKTIMTLLLFSTMEVLAIEVWPEELYLTIDRLATQYEHKVSFASLAFLSSQNNSAELYLSPLLMRYFDYLQLEWESIVDMAEVERMLRAVLDEDLRQFFKDAVFNSVGHILNECRREREALDNIALPPPWTNGGAVSKGDVQKAMESYLRDPKLVKQALRDLRRETITINGQVLPPAQSQAELAEYLNEVIQSNQMTIALSPRGSKASRRRSKMKMMRTNYTSDFGLETESLESGGESDTSLAGRIDSNFVSMLTRRLLISASRTGAAGDAYFIVRDLFGNEDVEVVPHQSHGSIKQGTIEIVVKSRSVTIKTHAKFDIFQKPVMKEESLIQFHTTTTETIALSAAREDSCTILREKQTSSTGWRSLAIRPAYYEKVPQLQTNS
ncbi:hypothetical protein THAOC_31003 [Thalassiosira oceanica]|uniref:Uncharacterized protein n=1 Tax=Thalassiosira oceanica TaxID=159749 RepID=K0RCS1_THAOC|nr:hypothetical protein THAOC_31003 [Thalassiosira oceanica]|eukprot:EJK50064.1 hypothetical protein THAOC_31003 [Thalassiosira oceanica]